LQIFNTSYEVSAFGITKRIFAPTFFQKVINRKVLFLYVGEV